MTHSDNTNQVQKGISVFHGQNSLDRKLRHQNFDGLVVDLPEWVQFYLQLGAFAASPLELVTERRVLGVAVPTRAFAAAFAAVGAVLRGVGKLDDQRTDDEFFEYVCSLSSNSPVKLRAKNKKGKERLYDGVFLTAQEISGQKMIKIQLEKASMADADAGGLTHYVPKNRVRDISLPMNDDAVTLEELPKNQKGSKVTPTSDFASSIIGSHLLAQFESEAKMACLIVGATSTLETELTGEHFLSSTGTEGTLSELLRIKKFLTPGNPYRSNIFATNSRRPPRYDDDSCPDLVIFDGVLGFLKWRDNFTNSHWLVLLDETNPNFESGRDTLNNLYVQRSGSDPAVDGIPPLPDGVEIMLFQEKKR